MNARLEVKGAAELSAEIDHACDELRDLSVVNARAAKYATAAARSAAPRRTGRLAGSARAEATATDSLVMFGSVSVPYARPIHYGWPRYNIGAQPWAEDATEQSAPAVVELHAANVDRLLGQIRGAR